ncbi:hypothetical protein GMLC_14590 [Geomonas limicola]|uniref:Uncharacterized protein n=1 Tax=Geomonas limicola TaxID=2740186 RepID=A0A6V8N655_9BACT|nr:hypothetical protein [Geomonas limicola]GFO67880.1 hypothetical protein GMLC_14590 [Geomonas limicola]
MAVSRVRLVIDGEEETRFKAIEESDEELAKRIKLMHGSEAMAVPPEYGVKLTYVIPDGDDGEERDFRGIKNGTLILEYPSGRMTVYTGVSTLKIGGAKFDGDNEAVREIELMATGRN